MSHNELAIYIPDLLDGSEFSWRFVPIRVGLVFPRKWCNLFLELVFPSVEYNGDHTRNHQVNIFFRCKDGAWEFIMEDLGRKHTVDLLIPHYKWKNSDNLLQKIGLIVRNNLLLFPSFFYYFVVLFFCYFVILLFCSFLISFKSGAHGEIEGVEGNDMFVLWYNRAVFRWRKEFSLLIERKWIFFFFFSIYFAHKLKWQSDVTFWLRGKNSIDDDRWENANKHMILTRLWIYTNSRI